jgi:hypothetical protein
VIRLNVPLLVGLGGRFVLLLLREFVCWWFFDGKMFVVVARLLKSCLVFIAFVQGLRDNRLLQHASGRSFLDWLLGMSHDTRKVQKYIISSTFD